MLWVVVGCSSAQVVSVLPKLRQSTAFSATAEDHLRVQIDASSVRQPIYVVGSNLAFSDVDRALALSIEGAILPIKQGLTSRRTKAYVLLIELIEAHSELSADRLVVRLITRATLREKRGNIYVAQTHAHASATGSLTASNGVDVVLDCTRAIGAQLHGWVSGIAMD